jgi:hypothetical protein
MHVAIALWIALTVASFNRMLGKLAFAYFAVIWFGSIYLGWHYFMDGIGGIAIALAAWGIAGRRIPSAAAPRLWRRAVGGRAVET